MPVELVGQVVDVSREDFSRKLHQVPNSGHIILLFTNYLGTVLRIHQTEQKYGELQCKRQLSTILHFDF